MPYVELSGVDLWFQDTGGSGAAVVFLHAASGTSDCWNNQTPAFTAAGFRCVAYDRRGWGRSRPTPTGALPGDPSGDLHGLLEHLGLDRCHLVATAAGGIVGLDYALSHPERVRSLVAANTIGGVQDAEYLEVQQRLRPPEIQNLPVELRELGPSYRGMNPEGVRRWLAIEDATRPDGVHGARQPPLVPITYERLENLSGPGAGLDGRRRLAFAPGVDAVVRGPHTRLSNGVSPGGGTLRFLGATRYLEPAGVGVHRPAVGRFCRSDPSLLLAK